MPTISIVFCCALLASHTILAYSPATPSFPQGPFSRSLFLTSPPMQGSDVYILQRIIPRALDVLPVPPQVPTSGTFDNATALAVAAFQRLYFHPPTGNLDPTTAKVLLQECSDDGYKEDYAPARAYGAQYRYKVVVPVYRNRSIETTGSLFDKNGTLLLNFTAHAHGHDPNSSNPWPDYDSYGDGLSLFASDGNTPTGLMEFDLNTPEDDPKLYGPYPINRVVSGLRGIAEIVLAQSPASTHFIRSGILLHTGEWPGWVAPMRMPNSAGCIHSWPQSIDAIQQILQNRLGVVAHQNTNGAVAYPYTPQGLLSVYQVDSKK